MEGNMHLLQVIRKMRSQIDKLERENRALRGELRACGPSATAARGGSLTGPTARPDPSPAAPCPGPAAGPAAAPSEQADTTMTVRRYSTAASAPAPPGTRPHRAGKRPPSSGLPEVRGRAQLPACPSAAQHAGDEGKGLGKTPANCFSSSSSNKMKLFQEHVRRCRGKVKAVSFLLPMDVSSCAENQGSLKSPQNQDTKELTTITEKDM
nr:putative coiled-coil domain-containing protein 195 [Anser cygnoides]